MRTHARFLGLSFAIAALLIGGAAGQDAPSEKKGEASAKQPGKDVARRLLKTQLQAAQKVYRAALESMEVQQVGDLLVLVKGNQHARPDLAYLWSVRWLNAQAELSESKEERTTAYRDHQKRMQRLQQAVKTLVGDGSGGLLQAFEAPAADWYLAESELWLLKEQGK
jgi:hypothetical protein